MPQSRRVLWQALERALFALAGAVREYIRLASEEAKLTTWAENTDTFTQDGAASGQT